MHLAKFKQHLPAICGAVLFLGTAVCAIFYSHWRSHRPPVVVREGMVFCRMDWDDFHFPLPSGAKGATVSIKNLGRDTINGSVFVSELDTASYESVLARHGFHIKPGSSMATDARQPGGWVWSKGGGRIDFSYFGDR